MSTGGDCRTALDLLQNKIDYNFLGKKRQLKETINNNLVSFNKFQMEISA